MRTKIFATALLFNCLFIIANAQTLEKVKEISAGFGNSNPYFFTSVGSKLFFIATDAAFQRKLYVSEGTDATTQLLGPPATVNFSVTNLIAYNNKLFFSCDDGINGQELWTSDGTVAGTVLFKDLYPGATGSYPQSFTVANGKLFFMGTGVNGERRLYVSDGTPAGTFIVRDDYIQLFNGLNTFAILNNDIYFTSNDVNGPYALWKSDGTPGGTVIVKGNFIPGVSGCNYAVLNNKLYFSGFDYTNGSELWVTDGTDPGTHIVKNLRADAVGILNGGSPLALTVFNSKLYFSAQDDLHGQELFVSDGTDPGTVMVKDIFPGPDGSLPNQITICNGFMYLTCWYQQELWKSDGTEAGTQLVKPVLSYTRFGAVWNNKMYLVSGDNPDLWQSDGTTLGTGPATVTNSINPITIFATDFYLTPHNGSLYFGGRCFDISQSVEPLRFVAAAPPVHNFSFTGNGNWSNPANWAGGIMPPTTLVGGDNIVINGNCILDIAIIAQSGSTITVAAGFTLTINGSIL
jgi:ELWxxDGT repeat protein